MYYFDINNKLKSYGYKFNFIKELIRYVTHYYSKTVIPESHILNYKDVFFIYYE